MKLYLSSYRIGSKASALQALVKGQKRIGVICNALDSLTDRRRLKEIRMFEFMDLEEIGLSPVAIDLREYFDNPDNLCEEIDQLDALWVIGGSSFILNSAMRQSGLSDILISKLADEDFVYAGYSAGICILAPTLDGIHFLDEPNVSAQGYPEQLPWNGLGIIPFCIVPHWQSNHPDSPLTKKVVAYFVENKIPYIALKDGDVYITSLSEMPNMSLLKNNSKNTELE